jgi:hypothetical protein
VNWQQRRGVAFHYGFPGQDRARFGRFRIIVAGFALGVAV